MIVRLERDAANRCTYVFEDGEETHTIFDEVLPPRRTYGTMPYDVLIAYARRRRAVVRQRGDGILSAGSNQSEGR
jgi:hypothetical protein